MSELAEPHKGRWAIIQPHLIDALQGIRDEVGPIVIGSGYRSPAYNRQVGGTAFSRHQYGDAADIYGLHASMYDIRNACEAQGASYIEVYDSHVHCDWRDVPLDQGFYGHGDTHSWHGRSRHDDTLSENESDTWIVETFAW